MMKEFREKEISLEHEARRVKHEKCIAFIENNFDRFTEAEREMMLGNIVDIGNRIDDGTVIDDEMDDNDDESKAP